MSLSSFLADLESARDRFRTLLSEQGLSVAQNATIHQCLDLLEAFWDSSSDSGSSSGSGSSPSVGERVPTTRITLVAPDDLSLYAAPGTNDLEHYAWDDADELTVKVLMGSTVLATECTVDDGMGDFEYNSITHLSAGNRVLVDLGSKPSGVESATLTIQWLRGTAVVKTETRTFDWMHTPTYFRRPAGEGDYSLKIDGSAVNAEVFFHGEWIDFPGGVLSSAYAGCPVRTKTETPLDAVACWSNDGADGDSFWYLT